MPYRQERALWCLGYGTHKRVYSGTLFPLLNRADLCPDTDDDAAPEEETTRIVSTRTTILESVQANEQMLASYRRCPDEPVR